MKNLKNLRLNDAKVLTSQEMKHLKGGSVYCLCLGDTGLGEAANSCDECPRKCGSKGVQNCNYISG